MSVINGDGIACAAPNTGCRDRNRSIADLCSFTGAFSIFLIPGASVLARHPDGDRRVTLAREAQVVLMQRVLVDVAFDDLAVAQRKMKTVVLPVSVPVGPHHHADGFAAHLVALAGQVINIECERFLEALLG